MIIIANTGLAFSISLKMYLGPICFFSLNRIPNSLDLHYPTQGKKKKKKSVPGSHLQVGAQWPHMACGNHTEQPSSRTLLQLSFLDFTHGLCDYSTSCRAWLNFYYYDLHQWAQFIPTTLCNQEQDLHSHR